MSSRHCSALAALTLLISACHAPPTPVDHVPVVLTVVAGAEAEAAERVLPGSLMARHETQLGFRTAGRVLDRKVEVGQKVAAGALLGDLDPADCLLNAKVAEAQRAAAEADLAQSERDAARFGRLGQEGALGSAEEERQRARSQAAKARLDAARREVDLAERRVGYTRLEAPFAGVVTQVQFEPGLSVTEGQPVLTLADPREIELVVEIPVALQATLARSRATMTLPDAPGATLPLRLRELAPQANPSARTVRARFSLTAALSSTLAGAVGLGRAADLHLAMAATTGVSSAGHSVLPAAALVQAGSEPFVYRVDPATQELARLPVQVLHFGPEVVEVAGIPPGTRVVAAGAQKVHAGLKVAVQERSTHGLDLVPPAAHP